MMITTTTTTKTTTMHRFGSEAIFFASLDLSGKVYYPGGGDVSGGMSRPPSIRMILSPSSSYPSSSAWFCVLCSSFTYYLPRCKDLKDILCKDLKDILYFVLFLSRSIHLYFLPSFFPTCLLFFLPSFLPSFFGSFLPSFLHSFLPSFPFLPPFPSFGVDFETAFSRLSPRDSKA